MTSQNSSTPKFDQFFTAAQSRRDDWQRLQSLAQAWSAAGGSGSGGHSLLVEQAAEQVRLMTGEQPPVEAIYAALER